MLTQLPNSLSIKQYAFICCVVTKNFNNNIVVAVVVAQLVEQSLPTPKVHGSNPVIGKILYLHYVNCIEKTKIN